MTLWVERVRLEVGHLARKLSGVKSRRRAQALSDFEATLRGMRPGDLAIDLGANVGLFAERMAATGCDVIAFEPDPHAFAKLGERLGDRPNVTLIAAAASDKAGRLPLMRHLDFESDPDRRTVSSTIVPGKRRVNETGGLDVEVKDFVAWLTELDRPVKLLKIDIEGAEVALLERLLRDPVAARIERIFVETHERVLIDLAARTRALKALSAGMARPKVNWDWR